MDETEELISMDDLRKGCPIAWNQAYPRLYRAIYGVLKSMVRPGPGLDLEDIASELIANEILPDFREVAGAFADANDFRHLLNLAKKAAYFRAKDAIRRSGRRKESALPENWEEFLGGTHEDPFKAEEGLDKFHSLISILKPPKPDLFEDHFIRNLKYEEISKERKMPLNTVCSHFSRGKKQIRKFLDEGQLPED